MDEISNKTLATLLVVAIVISLAGTFFAMRGVTQVTNYVSGFQAAQAPAVGNASVNISENIVIYLVNDTVNFGTGQRNASDITGTQICNLSSRGNMTGGLTDQCWEYTADGTNFDAITYFVLRNDGNVYVNVTINSTDAASFFKDEPTQATPIYQWTASDNTTGEYKTWVSSIDLGDATSTPEWGCVAGTLSGTTWTSFDETKQLICTNMSPYAAEDEFAVDINLGIPAGPNGEYSAAVTFEGYKSAQ